jgi:hypothetical protein
MKLLVTAQDGQNDNKIAVKNSMKKYLLFEIILSTVFLFIGNGNTQALADSDAASSKISAVSYVTWWSHDATGYHPAMFVKLENDSGKDLSGQLLKLQARFTDLRNGYVTVGRREVRSDFANNHQLFTILKGPISFELPIDENQWPSIECKVMCRVDDVGDEGTQTLLITHLESITMTDEEAMDKLSKMPDIRKRSSFAQNSEAGKKVKSPHSDAIPDRPMAATALALTNEQGGNRGENKKSSEKKISLDKRSSLTCAGLGDDFLDFDKLYGESHEWDARSGTWTWVHYLQQNPALDIFVGAKGQSTKADVLIIKIPAHGSKNQSQTIALAKSFAGKFKTQPLSPPTSSVKYLPSGRTEFTTLSAPAYKMLLINYHGPYAPSSDLIIAISRLPDDLRSSLAKYAKATSMLSFLAPQVEQSDAD